MGYQYDTTIAAISTAVSSAGIGIVRMSGPEAFLIADRIYKGKNEKRLSEQKSHTIHYGFIVDGEETIDEVLVMLMRGPRSFTGEDTVEINCHGGVYVVKRILETLIDYGARPAEPGEFTKRAFLNGRLDLSQAEAVGDLIEAQNKYALQSSVNQLKGCVRQEINRIRKNIIYHTAFIETALDDPEHISVDGYGVELKGNVEEWLGDIRRLLDTCDDGRIIKEGIRTVILGKPNAGKSSLLNVLLGEERAIVTDVEGTTRDVLEEHINLKGISLNIMDTAGIRDTEDIVEKIGVDRAKDYADQADLILYVIDSSRPLDENDCEIMRLIEGKTSVILLNKSDLEALVTVQDVEDMYFTCNPGGCGDKGESSVVDHQSCDNESNPAKNKGILMVDDDRKTEIKEFKIPVIDISAKDMKGIDHLEETLKKLFFEGNLAFNDEIYITNIRHKTALSDAYGALERVRDSIDAGMPEDFYSIDLMDAYEALGNITGETIGEDLVNEIFSKFCMGK
ncbi:MAG: tRNA uridine-5-carboxymethylaminomethyl(34) synthesis GTPase MnmE [Dorea sp.]|nr:tRNA uridine-5-carboxymethylaminomethyl(34) synthesis GTPase MnmE [Dorea sp.]